LEQADLKVKIAIPEQVDLNKRISVKGSVNFTEEDIADYPVRKLVDPTGKKLTRYIISASLFLAKLDDRSPEVVSVNIPTEIDEDVEPSGLITANFSFDLRKALPEARLKGKYQLYFIFGDQISGPKPLTVGAPALLDF